MQSIAALSMLIMRASSQAAEGAFESAGALLKYMTGTGIEERLRGWYGGYAFGYGIGHMQDGIRSPVTGYCFDLPADINKGEVLQRVRAHLEKHPGSRHETAERLVQEVLDQALPCAITRPRT
jgi:hypothetical protein